MLLQAKRSESENASKFASDDIQVPTNLAKSQDPSLQTKRGEKRGRHVVLRAWSVRTREAYTSSLEELLERMFSRLMTTACANNVLPENWN